MTCLPLLSLLGAHPLTRVCMQGVRTCPLTFPALQGQLQWCRAPCPPCPGVCSQGNLQKPGPHTARWEAATP